jgi:hypothetical protein
MKIEKNNLGKLYWGGSPLPQGSEIIGTISRWNGTGALIKLRNGNYVQGNAGSFRTLNQNEVIKILG